MKEDFKKQFQTSIRVDFNWAGFFTEYCKVSMQNFFAIDSYNWFTPWYLDKNGFEVSYYHREAKPLSLNDVLISEVMLSKRTNGIIECKDRLVGNQIVVEIPMYFLGGNKYLILDGNHRLLAVLIHGLQATIFGHVVFGPIDERMVPDLRHFMAT